MRKQINLYTKFPEESSYLNILDNEVFFNAEILSKSLEFTEREKEVMQDIDGISFIKGHYIETKFGDTHITHISTGLKTYLNLSVLQRLGVHASVYLTEAGPNILKYIFEDIDSQFFHLVLTHGEIICVDDYDFIVNGKPLANSSDIYRLGVGLEC